MHQFAWLENLEGSWLLLHADFKYPARSWIDRNTALAELREEGWTIKPHRKFASGKRIGGYAMMRTVH